MNRTEQDLIAASKSGDHAAFEALVVPYLPRVHALLLRMTGDRHAAEDLAQESMLRAFRRFEQFQGTAAFSTWFYRIAVNLSLRHIEQQKQLTFEQWPEVPNSSEAPHSPELNPEERVLVGQVREGCLTGLVRCLPRDQRLAFVLTVLVGLSVEDAASVLECSSEAIKTRVSRARQRLADFVDRRCEWIDPANQCRCKHFVQYSLQRGLIPGIDGATLPIEEIERVEGELDRIRRLTRLYESLPTAAVPSTLIERMRRGLAKSDWDVLG